MKPSYKAKDLSQHHIVYKCRHQKKNDPRTENLGKYKEKGFVSAMKGLNQSFETRKKISCKLRKISLDEWDGFSRKLDKKERVRFRKTTQIKVFERDDYTCQVCKVRGRDMTVDHIKPWAKYVDLRFDINNCRTLCVKCHYKITFGKPMPPKVRTWGHNMKYFKGGINL